MSERQRVEVVDKSDGKVESLPQVGEYFSATWVGGTRGTYGRFWTNDRHNFHFFSVVNPFSIWNHLYEETARQALKDIVIHKRVTVVVE